MGYSESAMMGIKHNGRPWRKTVRGVPTILEKINDAIAGNDEEEINSGIRKIGALFRAVWNDDASSGEVEALEWFEEETCTYEFEQGTMGEFEQEFNYRLNELYDWADYNRVWVSPDR